MSDHAKFNKAMGDCGFPECYINLEHVHGSFTGNYVAPKIDELLAAKAEIERLERLVGHTAEENKRLRGALEKIRKLDRHASSGEFISEICACCIAKSALSQKDGKAE